jgi:preprotein translocase subunit SecE
MQALSKLTTYLKDSKEEAKKISWPNRKETIKYSTIVLGLTILVAAMFGMLDFLFSQLLAWLIG